MKSLIIAFAMYSKFPMPRVDWEKKALSWALCWFPLVGLAVGAVLWLWLALAGWLGFGAVFTAALALLLPIALSGGIHLDGFCDTCDALSSHQSRERKLEILKDSHTAALATPASSSRSVSRPTIMDTACRAPGRSPALRASYTLSLSSRRDLAASS